MMEITFETLYLFIIKNVFYLTFTFQMYVCFCVLYFIVLYCSEHCTTAYCTTTLHSLTTTQTHTHTYRSIYMVRGMTVCFNSPKDGIFQACSKNTIPNSQYVCEWVRERLPRREINVADIIYDMLWW